MSQVSTPIIYSAPWCGHCTRLKRQLDGLQISYNVIDVDDHPEMIGHLEDINGGSWLIPTVEFSDGTALVNPSAAEVVSRVSEA